MLLGSGRVDDFPNVALINPERQEGAIRRHICLGDVDAVSDMCGKTDFPDVSIQLPDSVAKVFDKFVSLKWGYRMLTLVKRRLVISWAQQLDAHRRIPLVYKLSGSDER